MIKEYLEEAYRLLFDHFGFQNWWPGDTPFEIAVGAILTQNTNWKNVEKAISNLKSNGNFNAKNLYNLKPETLAELIRPAGYFRLKTKRLRNFLELIIKEFDGRIENMKDLNINDARTKLLSVSGIGPETADSIVLYALEKPSFVIDTYTFRMLMRHGMCDESETYDDLQSIFMDNLPENVAKYNEYHALIVMLGKNYCKPKPLCEECPLKRWANPPKLPDGDF